jgi:hypothetical protein
MLQQSVKDTLINTAIHGIMFLGTAESRQIWLKYKKFPIIWLPVTWHSILSYLPCQTRDSWWIILRDSVLSRLHLLTMKNKGRQLLQMYYCSGTGVTLPHRKGRRLRSKYPLLISSKNKFFHLQIYVMLNITSVFEICSLDAVLYFLHNFCIIN